MEAIDTEQYSMEAFKEMAQKAREAEENRIVKGMVAKKLDLSFAVASWRTERDTILQSLGYVIDKMLEIDGRSTGIFNVVLELPRPEVVDEPFHDQGNATNHRISQCTEACKENQ